MAKGLVEQSTMTAIADAIRAKTGTEDTYKPSEMADAISSITGGGGGDIEPIVFSYATPSALGVYSNVIEALRDGRIKFQNIKSYANLFYSDIFNLYQENGIGDKDYSDIVLPIDSEIINLNSTFRASSTVDTVPHIIGIPSLDIKNSNTKIQGMQYLFGSQNKIQEIPEDWITIKFDSSTNYLYGRHLSDCCRLRTVNNLYENIGPIFSSTYANSICYYGWSSCNCLKRIENIPININTLTTNQFNNAFAYCYSVHKITFATQEDGSPYTVNWKTQTIDLSYLTAGPSGNMYAQEAYGNPVTTQEEYEAVKGTEDWWAKDLNYRSYNHDSAVETINSLPDASAYLASSGGTNTIKFKIGTGKLTDGGAVDTLTDEEVAVATAKGWTVTLS